MATTTPLLSPPPPPISPHEEVENNHQQPPTACSPIEYVNHHHHHHQFTNSITPSPPQQPPENSTDRRQPPPSEDQQEPPVPPSPLPEENVLHRQQPPPSSLLPPSPPPTVAERPPENFSPSGQSALSKQPLAPPTTEIPVESPDFCINPNPKSDHEFPLSKQPPLSSPSQSPSTPPLGPDDYSESPNCRVNPSPNPNFAHESPSPSSPAKSQGDPKSNQSPKEPSLSPPLTTGSPPSPRDTVVTPPPLGVPLLLHAAVGGSPSKPKGSPWTNQETANLIQAYQEKWYSLKKGPLKAGQWEEVAITVAARCGYDEPTKTAKQCRYKMEKLRKRYRAERGKPRSKAAAWSFFKLMEDLENGPLLISSSQPMALVEYETPSNSNGKKRKNNHGDGDDDDEFLVNKRSSMFKSSNHHVPNDSLARNLRFSDGGNRVVRGLRTPVVHKRKGFYQAEEDDGGDAGGKEEQVVAQLAAEIKGFAQKFVKMESKKIEMIKDIESYRLQMEDKRIEMILESQQMLMETVNKAFSSSHKAHKFSAS